MPAAFAILALFCSIITCWLTGWGSMWRIRKRCRSLFSPRARASTTPGGSQFQMLDIFGADHVDCSVMQFKKGSFEVMLWISKQYTSYSDGTILCSSGKYDSYKLVLYSAHSNEGFIAVWTFWWRWSPYFPSRNFSKICQILVFLKS